MGWGVCSSGVCSSGVCRFDSPRPSTIGVPLSSRRTLWQFPSLRPKYSTTCASTHSPPCSSMIFEPVLYLNLPARISVSGRGSTTASVRPFATAELVRVPDGEPDAGVAREPDGETDAGVAREPDGEPDAGLAPSPAKVRDSCIGSERSYITSTKSSSRRLQTVP